MAKKIRVTRNKEREPERNELQALQVLYCQTEPRKGRERGGEQHISTLLEGEWKGKINNIYLRYYKSGRMHKHLLGAAFL